MTLHPHYKNGVHALLVHCFHLGSTKKATKSHEFMIRVCVYYMIANAGATFQRPLSNKISEDVL